MTHLAANLRMRMRAPVYGLQALFRRKFLRFIAYGLAGALMYLAQCSTFYLDVTQVDEFMNRQDNSAHYVGWQFFRSGPWEFPLGRIPDYVYPFGTTITQTDSIPWVAVIAKLFSAWLPEKFQYFGWWTLFCFVMQGVMAGRLFDARFKSFLGTMAAVTILLLSPPMMGRMFFHSALVAHWLVIWAIYLLFETLAGHSRWKEWALNLSFSIITHPYLYAMNLIVGLWCVVYAVVDCRTHPLSWKSVGRATMAAVSSLATGYVFGVFVSTGSTGAEGLGAYSANLNTFFNPKWWSIFLKPWPGTLGAYLGLGVLLSACMAFLTVITRWQAVDYIEHGKKLSLLIVFIFSLMAFALGPKVMWGSTLLFSYELPPRMMELWSVFRATSRFVWPVFYLVCFVGLLQYWHGLDVLSRGRWSRNVLGLWLLVLCQAADLSWAIRTRRWRFTTPRDYQPALIDSAWDRLGARYRHLVALPLDHLKYDELAQIAVRNNMTLNFGYVSRVDPACKAKALEDIDKLMHGIPDAQTAYIIKTKDLMDQIQKANPDLSATFIDGFWLVMP